MGWTMKQVDSAHWVALAGNDVRARMTLSSTGSDSVEVRFLLAPSFNKDMGGGMERAIGYVQGIERAAEVHAQETRQGTERGSLVAAQAARKPPRVLPGSGSRAPSAGHPRPR